MTWSCLPVCLFQDIISGRIRVADWAAAARDMGLDCVDLSILFVANRTPMGIAELKRQLCGMPVGMITCYPDFTQPEPVARERELAHALSDVAAAADLGARYIRLTAGQAYEGQSDDDAVRQVVSCFEKCCEHACRWGVRVLLENHSKPGAWARPDFDFHTGRFLRLVNAMSHLPVGINFDTANTYALGDDACMVFESVYGRVESIHVNDIADTERLRFVGIGDGGAPICEIFRIAKRRGFDGLLSIEECGRDGVAGIRRSFERAAALWADA